ncbi:hypothetical protein H4R35_004372 [Dimargaris xerosporica]|nr:hypothetical protein H4R35_004372 [Dimargaris xerosporica]
MAGEDNRQGSRQASRDTPSSPPPSVVNPNFLPRFLTAERRLPPPRSLEAPGLQPKSGVVQEDSLKISSQGLVSVPDSTNPSSFHKPSLSLSSDSAPGSDIATPSSCSAADSSSGLPAADNPSRPIAGALATTLSTHYSHLVSALTVEPGAFASSDPSWISDQGHQARPRPIAAPAGARVLTRPSPEELVTGGSPRPTSLGDCVTSQFLAGPASAQELSHSPDQLTTNQPPVPLSAAAGGKKAGTSSATPVAARTKLSQKPTSHGSFRYYSEMPPVPPDPEEARRKLERRREQNKNASKQFRERKRSQMQRQKQQLSELQAQVKFYQDALDSTSGGDQIAPPSTTTDLALLPEGRSVDAASPDLAGWLARTPAGAPFNPLDLLYRDPNAMTPEEIQAELDKLSIQNQEVQDLVGQLDSEVDALRRQLEMLPSTPPNPLPPAVACPASDAAPSASTVVAPSTHPRCN